MEIGSIWDLAKKAKKVRENVFFGFLKSPPGDFNSLAFRRRLQH